jgi:hypothetical protein
MKRLSPGWQDLSDGQWQEACRREAVIRPLNAQKKEEINAVASETGRPGFLKTL